MRQFARFHTGAAILLLVVLIGSVGYYLLESWSLLQSFFSAVLVISTLGLIERPKTTAGIALTIGLIVTGVGTLFYLLAEMAESVIEASLGNREERRMQRQIDALQRHAIICGFGRVGQHAARELAQERHPFVVVDLRPEALERAREASYVGLDGDATEDSILRRAGVERAAYLLVTTGSDATNVFITLSARTFNDDLLIIARANEDSAQGKLEKAGANHVIAPETIGGKRMAALAVRPDAAEIADSLIGTQDDAGWLDQTTVAAGSPLAGRRVAEAATDGQTSAAIIAIRRAGVTIINPGPEEIVREGDILVSVGEREQLGRLEALTHDNAEEQRKP